MKRKSKLPILFIFLIINSIVASSFFVGKTKDNLVEYITIIYKQIIIKQYIYENWNYWNGCCRKNTS